MSEEKRPRQLQIPIWGIFLLFLGTAFLLQSLNVLPWALWDTLWRFWPVLIIIAGLGILLRRYNVWLMSMLILALLFACLGIAIWQYESPSQIGQRTQSYSEPLEGLEQAQVEIDFNVGSLTISSLPSDSLNFVEADLKVSNENTDMRVDFRRQGDEGILYLSKEEVHTPFWNEDDNRCQVNLTRNIPLTLSIKSAASNSELGLSDLKVTELRLDLDAGNYEVMMPSSAGTTHAYIEADVANLVITIPDGVAARIKVDRGMSAFEISESRFSMQGGYYISEDFATARNQIYLEIESNVGRVQIK